MRTLAMAICCCATSLAQSVVIVNSGSTNSPGFQITMSKTGEAHYASRQRSEDRTVAEALAQRLYADIETARPLASLPPRRCMKSASFGTRLMVQFGDDESPDLSCGDGGNEALRRLIADVKEIIQLFPSRPTAKP
jgi:hypothetical protein